MYTCIYVNCVSYLYIYIHILFPIFTSLLRETLEIELRPNSSNKRDYGKRLHTTWKPVLVTVPKLTTLNTQNRSGIGSEPLRDT